jgi:hypothetical protein
MLDLEGLEGAATLSSLESQSRIFQYQDEQHPNIATPAQSNESFQQGLSTMHSQSANQMHESTLNGPSVVLEDNPMLDMDESSLAEFLNQVMMPASPNNLANPNIMGDFIPQSYPPRDIFNFGIDANLDFNDMDFGWISSQNSKVPMWNFNAFPEQVEQLDRGQQTPDVRSGITAGAEAFERSLWRWAPQKQEHAYAEQVNLSLPYKDIQNLDTRLSPEILDHRLEQNSRDRILAMLLSTCEPANAERVVTSFPSADLLDSLMLLFFRSELSRTDSWIHLPTFRPQSQRPELNGIVVAAGAILSTVSTVRKLGFAIQEAVRLSIPRIVCPPVLVIYVISDIFSASLTTAEPGSYNCFKPML